MAVLGILSCQIFELELAYLLAAQETPPRITVVRNAASQGFINAVIGYPIGHITFIDKPRDFVSSCDSALEFLVYMMEVGLHSSKIKLQKALSNAGNEISGKVDALFLGYGLCGNALDCPESLFEHADIPVFLPKDCDHPVDDCIGMLIGGREKYYAEQVKEAGTFFMTSGWVNHWGSIFETGCEHMSMDMIKRLFAHYKRTLLVSSPVMDTNLMIEKIIKFNRLFQCVSDVTQGSMDILQMSFAAAKAHVLNIPVKKLYPYGNCADLDQTR